MKPTIRPIRTDDIAALKVVLDSCGLFPSNLLDDMIQEYLSQPDSQQIWFTAVDQADQPLSIAYCAPEKFTEGTYNLYAIGVHKKYQGQGIGKAMMNYIEEQLRQAGHRILIVETSGADEFTLTRQFYDQCQYHREAVLREFWGPGEDKVIFWKKL